MNYNVHVFYKMIFSNKFGFILETVFSDRTLAPMLWNVSYLWKFVIVTLHVIFQHNDVKRNDTQHNNK